MANMKLILPIFLFTIVFCGQKCYEERKSKDSFTQSGSPPATVEALTCGKENPKSEKDCTKYGTGSGLLCCWIAESGEASSTLDGKCYLIPESKADGHNIDGCAEFENDKKKYWSCGNSSSYLKAITVLFVILVALF